MAKVTSKEIGNPKPLPREYTLVLNETEAALVKKLCGSISGNGEAREVGDHIYFALGNAGMDLDNPEYIRARHLVEGLVRTL